MCFYNLHVNVFLVESEEECFVEMEAASSRPVLYQVEYGTSKLQHNKTTILTGGSESYLADEALARGLSFKPSWGPTGILTTVDIDDPLFINTISLTSMDQKSFQVVLLIMNYSLM